MISEANIIDRIATHFPDYIGNDAASIEVSSDSKYIITKDILVEGVHFKTRYVSPKSLAYKALEVNLSDLAATGAKPEFIVLGVAIPKGQSEYISDFISHFLTLCQSEGVYIIGGDTTASTEALFISITAIGKAQADCVKTREGAKEKDIVCIAGPIGEAYLGLLALESDTCESLPEFKERFLFPKAKVREGIWLGKQSAVTSMMDVSDGLFIDLKCLAQASKVSAVIELEALPLLDTFVSACKRLNLDPIETALIGGEDYGLLFTVREADVPVLSEQFMKAFGYPMHAIGGMEKGEGIQLMKQGVPTELPIRPFSHFGEIS